MPLPPMFDAPDLAQAKALRDQARDMARHMGQLSHRLSQGADGWIYWNRDTAPEGYIDEEPWPLLTPENHAPAHKQQAQQVLREAARDIGLLEDEDASWGWQEFYPGGARNESFDTPEGRIDNSAMIISHVDGYMAKAIPAILCPVHCFQVIHLGGRRWYMSGGAYTRTTGQRPQTGSPLPRETVMIPPMRFHGFHGHLCAKFTIQEATFSGLSDPDEFNQTFAIHAFSARLESIRFYEGSRPKDSRVTRSYSTPDVNAFTISGGTYYWTLAHCSMRSGVPRIIQAISPLGAISSSLSDWQLLVYGS